MDIDGRTQKVRPVGSWVLDSGNVVAQSLAVSLDKPLEWAVGLFLENTELSLELWTVIADISGFDDQSSKPTNMMLQSSSLRVIWPLVFMSSRRTAAPDSNLRTSPSLVPNSIDPDKTTNHCFRGVG